MKNVIQIIAISDPGFQNELEAILSQIDGIEFQINFQDRSQNSYALSDIENILDTNHADIAVIPSRLLPYPVPFELNILATIKPDYQYAFISKKNSPFKSLFSKIDIRKTFGKVWLVGNGPGSSEYLTLKALKLIQKADIIFYDDLIDKSILDESQAEKIAVGKRKDYHKKEQEDINDSLYKAAQNHKTIVRLKGGDPSVFGHVGEEIAYLETRHIEVEVVPGITTAFGAAAKTHSPLTLRNVSASVAFCTAHNKCSIPVPNTDTIVYYMGANKLTNIAKKLIQSGRNPATPVNLIYNLYQPDEEIYTETLESIIDNKPTYNTPLIITVGDTCDKANLVKAFENKPRILYTGMQPEKYLSEGILTCIPHVSIQALQDYSNADEQIEKINNFDWLIFTNKYAVRYFFKRLEELGYDTRKVANLKICSIGKVTNSSLKQFGIIPDFMPEVESVEGILDLFRKNNWEYRYILIPQSNVATPTLVDGLKNLNNKVTSITIYENAKPDEIRKVELEKFDKIIFTSPSGIKNFLSIYNKIPENIEVITRGKETQKYYQSVKN